MILVFGSINIDLVARVPALPRPGETVLAERYAVLPGGKGANQAVAAARALAGAAPVRMAGAVGRDGFGALARQALEAEGTDTGLVRETDEATGCAFIQVDDAGENVITVASGANRLLAAEAALTGVVFAPGDILVLQMETPAGENLKAAAAARRGGARVVLNLAPAPPDLTGDAVRRLLDAATILVVNAHEARAAASALGAAPASPRDAARLLAGHGGAAVVATLGPEGAFAVLPGGGEMQAASPAIAAVDTTGAGDTFVGVLAAGLAEGLAPQAALDRACRAAALACLKLGAQSAMPHRAEISG
jgi:ribokinase